MEMNTTVKIRLRIPLILTHGVFTLSVAEAADFEIGRILYPDDFTEKARDIITRANP
jgi:hypothetical protein